MAALKGSKTEANLTAVTTPITPCMWTLRPKHWHRWLAI